MLIEGYRYGKAIGAWDDGAENLEAAGTAPDAPGVVTVHSADTVLEPLTALLAHHRAWDRFTPTA